MIPTWIIDLEQEIEDSKNTALEQIPLIEEDCCLNDEQKSSATELVRGISIIDISPQTADNIILL